MFRRKVNFHPIAIDFGAASLKLLQFADVNGQPALHAAAQYDLSTIAHDTPAFDDALRQALNDARKTAPFAGKAAVASLNIGDFQMKSLRLPQMPHDELAAAVEFEAQDRFDLSGKPAQFRHIVAGEVRHGNEIKEEVLVFATQDDIVEHRMKLLESVGMVPLAIDLAPCALARCFIRFLRRADDATAVNAFVDVGWRGASIVITKGMDLAFIKTVDIGGEVFTAAVARALNVTPKQARDLRLKRIKAASGRRANDAPAIAPDMDAAVHDALRPKLEQLTKDIQLCLRYYAVTFRGQRPDSLTFVGGESLEPSLIKTVSEEFDVPCMVGHPLRGIGNLGTLASLEHRAAQPSWAVACGLALRGSPWVQATSSAGPRVPCVATA